MSLTHQQKASKNYLRFSFKKFNEFDDLLDDFKWIETKCAVKYFLYKLEAGHSFVWVPTWNIFNIFHFLFLSKQKSDPLNLSLYFSGKEVQRPKKGCFFTNFKPLEWEYV